MENRWYPGITLIVLKRASVEDLSLLTQRIAILPFLVIGLQTTTFIQSKVRVNYVLFHATVQYLSKDRMKNTESE